MNAINRKTTKLNQAQLRELRAGLYEDLVEDARYPDRGERALALFNFDHDTLYPQVFVLRRLGFNIKTLGLLLQHEIIDGQEIARHVNDVVAGRANIRYVNYALYLRRPLVDGKGNVWCDADLAKLGLDVEAVHACRGRTMEDEQLVELVANVTRGWTKPHQANTGLGWMADAARNSH